MATHLRTELVVDALEMALWRRNPAVAAVPVPWCGWKPPGGSWHLSFFLLLVCVGVCTLSISSCSKSRVCWLTNASVHLQCIVERGTLDCSCSPSVALSRARLLTGGRIKRAGLDLGLRFTWVFRRVGDAGSSLSLASRDEPSRGR